MQTNRLNRVRPTVRRLLNESTYLKGLAKEEKWKEILEVISGHIIRKEGIPYTEVISKVKEEVNKYRVEELISG